MKAMRTACATAILAGLLLAPQGALAENQAYLNSSHVTAMQHAKQEYWIVTNEIKAKIQENGQEREFEVYRWDPGFLVVDKDKPVTLHIYGVKGKSHPFEIEGLGVKGDVTKGKVTTVTFTPKQKGTFRIVCLSHATKEQEGPMIGYLRVE